MRDQTMKIPQAEENIRDQQCPESLGKTRLGHTNTNTKPQLRPTLSTVCSALSSKVSGNRARYLKTDLDEFYF